MMAMHARCDPFSHTSRNTGFTTPRPDPDHGQKAVASVPGLLLRPW